MHYSTLVKWQQHSYSGALKAANAAVSISQINDLAEARVAAMCKGGYILRGLEKDNRGGDRSTPKALWGAPSPYQTEVKAAGLAEENARRWQVMSWAYKPEDALTPYCKKQRDEGRTHGQKLEEAVDAKIGGQRKFVARGY